MTGKGWIGIALLTTLLSVACQPQNKGIDIKTLNIFSDFVFVGAGEAQFAGDKTLDTTYCAPHNESEQPKPENLRIGVQYIFHHRAPIDNESLALHELPDKLSQLGFKVLEAPKSSQNLIRLYYGGPIFYIKFSDGYHEGIIFNGVDARISTPWTPHDYVLVYIR